jgi:hypothetical protein
MQAIHFPFIERKLDCPDKPGNDELVGVKEKF